MTNEIKSEIRKVCRVSDELTGTVVDVIEFKTHRGQIEALQVAPSIQDKTGMFLSLLKDKNAVLPKDPTALAKSLAQQTPARFMKYVAEVGWASDMRTYAFKNGALGADAENILGLSPGDKSAVQPVQQFHRGSWKEWRDSVSRLSMSSSVWVCTVCAGFAGPLLVATGLDSFTLCLTGPSRSGKSIGTILAASFIGFPSKRSLPNWHIKSARLDERLREFNDSLFPIDDLEVLQGSKRQKYQKIHELAYRVATGTGTARHSSFDRLHNLKQDRWRCVVVTSAETAISELAAQSNESRQGGQTVRFIDLPVVSDRTGDIFDRAVDLDEDRDAWKKGTFEAAVKACAQQHGKAFKHYISQLIDLGDQFPEIVRRYAKEFESRTKDATGSDLSRDMARSFALLYAGGRLAIDFNLVTWDAPLLFSSVRECFLRARNAIVDDVTLLEEGKRRLANALVAAPVYKKSSGSIPQEVTVIREVGLAGSGDALIRREKFNRVLVSDRQRGLVEGWLRDENLVERASRKSGSSEETKQQEAWPDGSRRRSLKIRLSRAKCIAMLGI